LILLNKSPLSLILFPKNNKATKKGDRMRMSRRGVFLFAALFLLPSIAYSFAGKGMNRTPKFSNST